MPPLAPTRSPAYRAGALHVTVFVGSDRWLEEVLKRYLSRPNGIRLLY